jgi:esterase/lipase superfamily enzyme
MRTILSMRRLLLVAASVLGLSTPGFAIAAPGATGEQARGDAVEKAARAQIPVEHWKEGLALADEVVRIRRAAQPVDYERLATALALDATFLFANDRFEDSDAMLTESLDAWARAYGPGDIRYAEKLEQQAEFVEKGFGRTDWVIELLRKAVDIRRLNPSSSGPKLAETLTELSIHEMNRSEYSQADPHLSEAVSALRVQVAKAPSDTEAKALLVQALVLRSGIAAKLAKPADSERLAREAGAVTFDDRYSQVDMKLTVLEALGTQFELTGQIDSAIAEERRIEQLILANMDLFDERRTPALDIGLLGDVRLSLAELCLEQGDLACAASSLANARRQLGDTSGVLFALSELSARRGDDAAAVDGYRAALKLRKENAAEVAVLFGTNRSSIGKGASLHFGAEASKLTLGAAALLVPGAQFSTTAWLKRSTEPPLPVGQATDASQLLIRSTETLDDAAFRARAEPLMKAARLDPGAVLVFVHGFNVSFDAAIKRAAQLRRDLNFDGPVAVFSWPSQGSVLRYGTDRQSADASVARLYEFLGKVADATGAKKIHVVAHSMGNRVLLPALVKVADASNGDLRVRLGEIVLAAPAVPEAEFNQWLDDIVGQGVGHITLYASQVDRALEAGWFREWGTTLAGYSSRGVPLTHAHMQSIDITKGASGDLLDMNHDVFASNPVMSEDIRQLLQSGSQRTPDQRLPTLLPKKGGAGVPLYWSYEPPARHP